VALPPPQDARPPPEPPTREGLLRLKLHVARQAARTIQVDMAGLRDAGDHRSLAFAAQELMGHAIDAMLAAYGLSNPLLKWRSRLLERVPRDWELAMSVAPSGLTAGDRIWRLLR